MLISFESPRATLALADAVAHILHAVEQQEPFIINRHAVLQILQQQGLNPEKIRSYYDAYCSPGARRAAAAALDALATPGVPEAGPGSGFHAHITDTKGPRFNPPYGPDSAS